MALVAAACAVPSTRENVEATAQLVRSHSRASLEWRRDSAADQAARVRASELLEGGVTLDEAVGVAFLINPSLQVWLEQLTISRAELVAALTPPNPVAIVGSRKPGGDLAAFYPERSVSIGVLQNVIALLTMHDRAATARHDLERARYETAQQAVSHAAQVVQAWLEYCAALQIHQHDGQDQAIQSELTVATTRARLGELMGVTGWRDDWEVVAHLPAVPDTDPDPVAIEAAAMQQRLDLRAAAKAVDVRLRALAMHRRFRWLNQLDIGLFRDKAIGGTAFTGPNVVAEIPLFDQRLALLLQSDAELHIALRRLEAAQLAARTEIRVQAAELRAMRQQLQQFEGEREQLMVDPTYVGVLREYWRTRSALALAAGDWAAVSGL
ncbi:MAG: TolC family protein [Steroidobacteraceae bacterium]